MSDTGREAAYYKWGDPSAESRVEHSWAEVAEYFGITRETIRSSARAYRNRFPSEFAPMAAPKLVNIEGVQATEGEPDEEDVYKRACVEFARTEKLIDRKRNQHIDFDAGPVAIVWTADHHFGDDGVDYPRAFEEAELIRDTPGMWLGLGGDMANAFVIGSLRQARDEARLNIPDEWALIKRYLRIVADKLLFTVPGNHIEWMRMLTGIDYFADVVGQLTDKVIYDNDEILFELNVGDWSVPCRARHKWRGLSQWNDTHEIEKAAKFDQDFLIGFGAHTHKSGLCRDMNVGGRDGMALLAGSYKIIDPYARRMGFYKPNTSTAVAVVIDAEYHSLTGFNNLQACASYMNYVYE